MISRRTFIQCALTAACTAIPARTHAQASTKPNIVFIIADDIGYGDVGCFGATHVKTPNIDRLAREGMRCTDAHSTAAVCTPTRYSILTGEYAWRNPFGDHILSGVAPLSIRPDSSTTPSLLRDAGYATGLVGKWHLGLGTPERPVDYNQEIVAGPLDIGFDYAYFLPATGDRVPCVFVENRLVVGLDPVDPIRVSYEERIGDDPIGTEHPELLKIKADESHSKTIVNGVSRIGYMSGGKTARWVDEDIADTFAQKAVSFIERQSAEKPFFLYFAPHDIHDPMVPHARFKGTSDCGSRGDVIQELDWCIGEVLGALERQGLADNTLVILTSDNGGAIKDTYDDGTNPLHERQKPNGVLRGTKGMLYEGGHRVPFIAKWPGKIAASTESNALFGLVDMCATFCAFADKDLPPNAAVDSFNVAPILTGLHNDQAIRQSIVLQNNGSKQFALRSAQWKLIPRVSKDGRAGGELYDLRADLSETTDLSTQMPERVNELLEQLNNIRQSAKSRP